MLVNFFNLMFDSMLMSETKRANDFNGLVPVY